MEKLVLTPENMITIIEQHPEHFFTGLNTQQVSVLLKQLFVAIIFCRYLPECNVGFLAPFFLLCGEGENQQARFPFS